MPFGSLFRESCEERRLSLSQAAWRIGITPAELKRIEEGKPVTSCAVWEGMRDLYDFPRGSSV
jgi:hypothetical protein